jgi:hypothetical protein
MPATRALRRTDVVVADRAEQQHLGAGKAGGDGDQMVGEVGDEGLRLGRARRQRHDDHEHHQGGAQHGHWLAISSAVRIE